MMHKTPLWQRIPRKLKVAVYAVVIVLLVLALYAFLGSPTLTPEQEFRRAEKAHLVGPGTIVDRFTTHQHRNHIVAETSNGVIFFTQSTYSRSGDPLGLNRKIYNLHYRPKTDDITVLAAPDQLDFYFGGSDLRIYTFADVPDAVTAEITILFDHTDNDGTIYKQTLSGTAELIANGVFRCDLDTTDQDTQKIFGMISGISCGAKILGTNSPLNRLRVPVIVQFYNAQRQLIAEKRTDIKADNLP